jgi:hypothetical protein
MAAEFGTAASGSSRRNEAKSMFDSLLTILRRALDDGVSVVTFGYLVGLLGLLGLVHWLAGAGYLTLSP